MDIDTDGTIWRVQYAFAGENIETMLVNAPCIDVALMEAHNDISFSGHPYRIFSVWTDDNMGGTPDLATVDDWKPGFMAYLERKRGAAPPSVGMHR